jgi:hypothetical protein
MCYSRLTEDVDIPAEGGISLDVCLGLFTNWSSSRFERVSAPTLPAKAC